MQYAGFEARTDNPDADQVSGAKQAGCRGNWLEWMFLIRKPHATHGHHVRGGGACVKGGAGWRPVEVGWAPGGGSPVVGPAQGCQCGLLGRVALRTQVTWTQSQRPPFSRMAAKR